MIMERVSIHGAVFCIGLSWTLPEKRRLRRGALAAHAGDSFDAGFLRLYSEGYSIRDCVKAGNICAGYTISHSEFRAVPEYEKLTEAIR